jgi:hypothetical protein
MAASSTANLFPIDEFTADGDVAVEDLESYDLESDDLQQEGGYAELAELTDLDLGITDPDLTSDAMKPLPISGGGSADAKKRSYSVVKVIGGAMPSKNAKYCGSTPSAALAKAARRIHKQGKSKTRFSVLMRRVSPKHSDRELYQYDVTMIKRAEPTGFLTVAAPGFKKWDKVQQRYVVDKESKDKRVRVVRSSTAPLYGYINDKGEAVEGDAKGKPFSLTRPAQNNTLYLVIKGKIPPVVQGINVIITEWDVSSKRADTIAPADIAAFDTAGAAKEREAALVAKKKALAAKKKAQERARAAEAKEKEQRAAARAKAKARR